MALFRFANKPIGQPENNPTVGRQGFGEDIVQLGQNIIDAVISTSGNPDFCILSGVEYTESGYTSGVVILKGNIYYFPGGLLENKYLVPDDDSVQLQLPKTFSDLQTYPTYRVYTVKIANSSSSASSPQFIGEMTDYHLGLQSLKYYIDAKSNESLNQTSGKVFSITDSGGSYDITGETTSHPMVTSTGAGGGTINYHIPTSGCNLIYWDVFGSTSSSTTFKLYHDTLGSKLLKTATFAQSHGAKYLFIRIDGGTWIEITSFTEH